MEDKFSCTLCELTIKELQALSQFARMALACYNCYCRAYVPLSDPLLKRLRIAVKAAIDEIKH